MKKTKEPTVYAYIKGLRITSRKMRLVANLIRKQKVEGLSDKLNLINKKAAALVKKALDSAIANAQNNNDWDLKTLYVREVKVDEGVTYKKGRAASKGRYNRILKRTCQITIGLSPINIINNK